MITGAQSDCATEEFTLGDVCGPAVRGEPPMEPVAATAAAEGSPLEEQAEHPIHSGSERIADVQRVAVGTSDLRRFAAKKHKINLFLSKAARSPILAGPARLGTFWASHFDWLFVQNLT